MLNLLKREHGSQLETRDAAPRPTTFDPRERTIEAVIASAAPVKRTDARGPFVEILDPAGLDIPASRGASVLDSHQQNGLDNVLGTLDDIRIEGNQVIGVIRFSSRPEIKPIIEDIRNGVIQHLSVGYQVDTWRDAEGNGIRSRTATKWVIHEASFVSVPADRSARTRSATPPDGADRAGINRSIRELCHRAGVDQSVIDGLVDTGASIETARGVVLDQLVTRGRASIMTVMSDTNNREGFIAAAGEALYARANPSARISPAARPFVGLSIADLARESLHRNGVSTTMMNASTLIERALGGLHSTSDFPALLGDALGRSLRQAYASAPSGLRQLAREASAADFRLRHRIMLDSTGMTLELVPEGGEYKSGTLAEGDATYKLQTFGRIIGFTRQAMINDDLGALTDMPRRLGSAAASFEAGFLTQLLISNGGLGPTMPDGLPLFHANHGNFDATGGPPNEQTLSDARLAMRKQTGLTGGLIDVTPWAVVVPPALETSTEKLLSTIRAISVDDVNVFSTLKLIVEPRLTDATRWYVVANPATADGLEYCYLSGSPGPQIETRVGFNVDGIEFKVRLDYGAGFVDYRSWFSNAGA